MLGNSITVLNKSGKVVSNGKHLGGVWKEAKAAYQSRKAELKADRARDYNYSQARHDLQNLSLSDEHLPRRKPASRAGSSRSVARSKSGAPPHRRRTSAQHEHGSERHRDGTRREHHTSAPHARPGEGLQRAYTESAYANDTVYSHPDNAPSFERPDRQLARRNTMPPAYDEDLAYGNLPPHMPVRPSDTELELKGKMTVLNRLLEEANCLQYSASSMIEHLQRNPDALAAVGLTLAEISTLARKVGPVAFANVKTMFPAAVALLASPQFLIAGGVAVGVTVVMLGGYKIIKRAKAKKALEQGGLYSEMDELREIEGELSGIEMWRRGIADAQEDSVGTSVDGEFITPHAAQRQITDGVMQESDLKPKVHRAQSERSHRSHRSKSYGGANGAATGHHESYDDATTAVARSERSLGARRRHSHQHGSGNGSGSGRGSRSRAHEDDGMSRASSSSKREHKNGTTSSGNSTARKAVGGLKMLFKGKSAPSLR